MKLSFSILLLSLCLACAKQYRPPVEEPKPVDINVPKPSRADLKDAEKIFFTTESTKPSLSLVLASVHKNINNNAYLLSNIVPPNSFLKKDKAIHFLPKENKTKNLFKKSDEIIISLTESEKYASNKLRINYYDARGNAKSRTWLFPLNLSSKQLEDHVTNAVIRFSFQSL